MLMECSFRVDRVDELTSVFKLFDIDGGGTIGFDELLALGTPSALHGFCSKEPVKCSSTRKSNIIFI